MPSPASFFRYLRSHGVLRTLSALARLADDARRAWPDVAFDLRYGTDTRGLIDDFGELGVRGAERQHAFGYQGIQVRVFQSVMQELQVAPPGYTFIDFGSGKGRAVMLAAERRFAAVHGVELSPRLHEIATRNCARFRRRCPAASAISLHCRDAAEFEIPAGDLVCFFYNPFDRTVMRRVLANVAEAHARAPRRLLVAYRNPSCSDAFEAFPFLRPVCESRSYNIYSADPGTPA